MGSAYPSHEPEAIGNDNNSVCVMQCCDLVTHLESYIQAKMDSFQILVGEVRKANENLNEMIEFQMGSRNICCLMLFNTIVYQILNLLTCCHKAMSSQNGRRLSSLRFNKEEQSAWQTHTILKEIEQVLEIVRKMKVLAGIRLDPESEGPAQSSKMCECFFSDLQYRLTELDSKVRGRI